MTPGHESTRSGRDQRLKKPHSGGRGRGQGNRREQSAAEAEQSTEGGQPPAPPGAKSRAGGPPTTEPRTAGGRGTAPQRQQTGRRAQARPGASRGARPRAPCRPTRTARREPPAQGGPQAAAVAKKAGGRKQGPRPGGGAEQAQWRPESTGRQGACQSALMRRNYRSVERKCGLRICASAPPAEQPGSHPWATLTVAAMGAVATEGSTAAGSTERRRDARRGRKPGPAARQGPLGA